MNIKKIIVPLLLVTQVCYGADAKALEGSVAMKKVLADTQQSLTRVIALLDAHPEGLLDFVNQINPAVRIFKAAVLKAQRDLEDAADKPRSKVPLLAQPQEKFFTTDAFPGLKGGSDSEND